MSKFRSLQCLALLMFVSCSQGGRMASAETPQQLMDDWVGTWKVELKFKKSLLIPEEMTIRGTETIRWVLNKQFLQSDQSYEGGDYKKLVLIRYDPDEGIFLFWDFDSKGGVPMGITSGTWNQAKSEIVISGQYIGGATAEGVIRLGDDDRTEMNITVTGADGTVLLDFEGSGEKSN